MNRRWTFTWAIALSAVVAGLLFPSGANAEPGGPDSELLYASDNVGAAIGWSGLWDAATEVVLARDDLFADSLTSGAAQGAGPLLLTPGDHLDARVLDELARLGATTVHVLGGDAAVTPAVIAELEQEGYIVDRVAGATRVETATEIADAFAPDADTVIVARGFAGPGQDPTQAFADSLAAGAWAADEGWPILLTETDSLSDATAAYLESQAFLQVFVVGGTAAVGPDVFEEIQNINPATERVAGDSRFSTATAIAAKRGFAGGADSLGLIDGVGPDAWAGGFPAAGFSALEDAPIVLTNGSELPEASEVYLGSGAWVRLVCFGIRFARNDWAACESAAFSMDIPFELVDVDVLVFGERRYPVEQFEQEPAHEPNCDALHWHAAAGPVYPLEARGAVLFDPGGCGFGRVTEVTRMTATVSRSQVVAYQERRAA